MRQTPGYAGGFVDILCRILYHNHAAFQILATGGGELNGNPRQFSRVGRSGCSVLLHLQVA